MPMPTAPKTSIDKLFADVEKQSAQIRRKSTDLSKKIEEIQIRLQSLPGKTRVSVTRNECVLSFNRLTGNEWALFYKENKAQAGRALTTLTVDEKIAAIDLLPALMAEIRNAQNVQLSKLTDALNKLDSELSHNAAEDK